VRLTPSGLSRLRRPSRARRRPLHAAKRARRRRLQLLPRLQLHTDTAWRARLGAQIRVRARTLASPVPVVVAKLWRWRKVRVPLTLERRRARTVLGAAIVLASLILLTSFPLGGVLSQRSALSSTAHELNTVKAENQSLGRQVSALGAASTINALARHDFGFAPAGQRVYDVLPSSSPSGSRLSGSGASNSGPDQVPLDGPPVVPGSARSQALIGVVAPAGVIATRAAGSGGADSGSGQGGEPRSYWGRVVRSLEFWN
jgi:hypothetical protein